MSWSHGRTRQHHCHTKDRVHIATPQQEHRFMDKSPLQASCCFSQSATLVRHLGKLEPIDNVQPDREQSTRSGRFNPIGKIQPDQKRWNLPDRVYASREQVILRMRRLRSRPQRPQAVAWTGSAASKSPQPQLQANIRQASAWITHRSTRPAVRARG